MSELEKDRIILELQQRVNKLEGKNEDGVPTYSFSKIKVEELHNLVDIEEIFDYSVFDDWFKKEIIKDKAILFLQELLDVEAHNIKSYNEEDLKMKFLSPLFTYIKFTNLEYNFRDFYEYSLEYKTDNFIFTGVTDFILSKGIKYIQKPYFFIQEFKKGKVNTDPEPQLLAELISAIELNNETSMRGAYIVGATWNFVILEKLGKDNYRYFVSRDFNCTNIEDLKGIYKNLIFVKNEIIEKILKEQVDG